MLGIADAFLEASPNATNEKWRGEDLDFDYYVDPVNGDDGNNGETPATAFETIDALVPVLNALTAGQSATCLIKSGTYTNQDVHLSTMAGSATLVFEPKCTIIQDSGADNSCLETGDTAGASMTVYGNWLRITGFDTGTGNGLGCSDNTMTAMDINIDDCRDGISAHGEGHMVTFRINATDCQKNPVTHIDDATSVAQDCYFKPDSILASGIVSISSTGSNIFKGCAFEANGAKNLISGGSINTVLKSSRAGTLTAGVKFGVGLGVYDSYIHALWEGNMTLDMERCWGRASQRLRDGGSVTINNCVFSNYASIAGENRFVYTDFEPAGNFGPTKITNIIFTNYLASGTSAFELETSGRAAKWENGGSYLATFAAFGNTDNFDTSAEAQLDVTITGISYTGPSIGSADTYNRADYAAPTGVRGTLNASGDSVSKNIAVPTISGSTGLGDTLTATSGTWSGNPQPTYAYQWKRDDVAISGATAQTYILVEADEGADITVTVTATNGAGAATATSAATPISFLGTSFYITHNVALNGETFTIKCNSTGTYNAEIDWGDSSTSTIAAWNDADLTHTYATAGQYSVKVTGTLERLKFDGSSDSAKLVSITGSAGSAGLTHIVVTGPNTLSGDVADLPASLTSLYVAGSNTLSGDVADLPAGLTYLSAQGSNTLSGDVADLPAGLMSLYVLGSNTLSVPTTTPWRTGEMRYVRLDADLTQAEVDNLLIALANATSWAIEKVVDLEETGNAARSSASDAAVATITGLGATVLTN